MARFALLLAVLVLALAGCELQVQLNIEVADGGSGRVEVAIGLDDDALARRPDLADELDLDDLGAAGWVVTGPTTEADGRHWIRAHHDFDHPAQVAALVDEVAGPRGPFRDVQVVRRDGFARTRYDFSGLVDFTAGLDDVTSDPELSEALGAEPGQLLAERFGAVVDELVTVQVGVRLPGDVDSNAPTRASNGAVWRPSVLEREAVELSATSTVSRDERWVWLGVGVAAGFALVLYLLVRLALWRRARSLG